jgi:hypothetical protein
VLFSWSHWSPRALAPFVTVLLLVVDPQVALLVVPVVVVLLVALKVLLVVDHLVVLASVSAQLRLAAVIALVVVSVDGLTETLLDCFC